MRKAKEKEEKEKEEEEQEEEDGEENCKREKDEDTQSVGLKKRICKGRSLSGKKGMEGAS